MLRYTDKEQKLGQATFVKMDAVALQGVWPTSVFADQVEAGGAPKYAGMMTYLLQEEMKRGRRLAPREYMSAARRNLQKLEETIKRFEIRDVTRLVLFLEAV